MNWNVTQYDISSGEVTVNFIIPEGSGRLGYYHAQEIHSDDGLSSDEMFANAVYGENENSINIDILFAAGDNKQYRRIYFFVADEAGENYVIPHITSQQTEKDYFALPYAAGTNQLGDLFRKYNDEMEYVNATVEESELEVSLVGNGTISYKNVNGDNDTGYGSCVAIYKGDESLNQHSFHHHGASSEEYVINDFSQAINDSGEYELVFWIYEGEYKSKPQFLTYTYTCPENELKTVSELKWCEDAVGVCSFKTIDSDDVAYYEVAVKCSLDGGNYFFNNGFKSVYQSDITDGYAVVDMSGYFNRENAVYKIQLREVSNKIDTIAHSQYIYTDIYDPNAPVEPDDSETPGDSETPDDSETPGDSEIPDDTETPEGTETPDDSETPEGTETPDDTETTEKPSETPSVEGTLEDVLTELGAESVEEVTAEEIVSALEGKSEEEKKELVAALKEGFSELKKNELQVKVQTNSQIRETLKALEDNLTGVTFKTEVAQEAQDLGIDPANISILGAKLNAEEGASEVKLEIKKATVNNPYAPEKYTKHISLEIDLTGVKNADTDLDIPVRIGIPVPAGIDISRLVVMHMKADGTPEEIFLSGNHEIDNGKRIVYFTVKHFSEFIFAEEISADTGNNGNQNAGSSTGSSENENAGGNTGNNENESTGNSANAGTAESAVSPKTAENNMVLYVALLAIAAFCGVVYSVRKAK